MAITDRRARITPKLSASENNKKKDIWNLLFGEDDPKNVLYPLRHLERGLIFPYTPTVTTSSMANYSTQNFSHSNYGYKSWQNSDITDIQLTGLFTAGTTQEATYMLAAIHFLKSAMKGGFGIKDNARGVPPPVFHFNYLGEYQFKNVPVVITNVMINYENSVDYVPVLVNGEVKDHVPTVMDISITMSPKYNTKYVRDEFSIEAFRSGKLLTDAGNKDGFI